MDGFVGAGGMDARRFAEDRGFSCPRPRALVVIGGRPEAVKLAPVVDALTRDGVFETAVLHAGQPGDMAEPACRLFPIPLRHDLEVMRPAQDLAGLASAVTRQLGEVIARERPAVCIVQGDSTVALAAALASFDRRVPVAHVEAGLRAGDMAAPWPEEANRVMISRLSRLHFAPTPAAAAALAAEGIDRGLVHVTGETVADAAGRARDGLAGPRIARLLARALRAGQLEPGEAPALAWAS